MPTFPTLIADLPPELYNETFTLTFTTDSVYYVQRSDVSPSRPQLNCFYKIPSSLWADRQTSEKFAASYYGESIFYIAAEDLAWWLAPLLRCHIRLLKDVRILGREVGPWNVEGRVKMAMEVYHDLSPIVKEKLAPSAIKLRVQSAVGEAWVSTAQIMDERLKRSGRR